MKFSVENESLLLDQSACAVKKITFNAVFVMFCVVVVLVTMHFLA